MALAMAGWPGFDFLHASSSKNGCPSFAGFAKLGTTYLNDTHFIRSGARCGLLRHRLHVMADIRAAGAPAFEHRESWGSPFR
jgi:hypothetical protein